MHFIKRKIFRRSSSTLASMGKLSLPHLPYEEIKRQEAGEEQSPYSTPPFCFLLFVTISLSATSCFVFLPPLLRSSLLRPHCSLSPPHNPNAPFLELQGTALCFISLLIFLRDWYLHTQIHTMLLCGAGGGEGRGLYFPLELGHLMTNDNG